MLGVASSAGAMTPGIEKAPDAVRAAGLVSRLRESGAGVEDLGDVVFSRWQPDTGTGDAHNVAEVARVAARTRAAVERVILARRTPLVLGGDCTVTVGVVAGVAAARPSVALHYVDGGPDLYTPDGDSGAHLDEPATSVRLSAGSDQWTAVVLTEVNPDHAPDAGTLPRFFQRFADALTGW